MESIITAVITGLVTLSGVLITNAKTQAVIQERINHIQDDIRRLEQAQIKHNNLIERTYKLEERVSVLEAKTKE